MEFASADPSVVKSIRQRYLLNEWLRAAGKQRPMPLLRDFHLDRVDDEMVDMMGYDVVGEGDGARFLITHQGARLATTYGNERIDPAERPTAFSTSESGPSAMPTLSIFIAPAFGTSGRPIRSRRCRTPTARRCPMNGC